MLTQRRRSTDDTILPSASDDYDPKGAHACLLGKTCESSAQILPLALCQHTSGSGLHAGIWVHVDTKATQTPQTYRPSAQCHTQPRAPRRRPCCSSPLSARPWASPASSSSWRVASCTARSTARSGISGGRRRISGGATRRRLRLGVSRSRSIPRPRPRRRQGRVVWSPPAWPLWRRRSGRRAPRRGSSRWQIWRRSVRLCSPEAHKVGWMGRVRSDVLMYQTIETRTGQGRLRHRPGHQPAAAQVRFNPPPLQLSLVACADTHDRAQPYPDTTNQTTPHQTFQHRGPRLRREQGRRVLCPRAGVRLLHLPVCSFFPLDGWIIDWSNRNVRRTAS